MLSLVSDYFNSSKTTTNSNHTARSLRIAIVPSILPDNIHAPLTISSSKSKSNLVTPRYTATPLLELINKKSPNSIFYGIKKRQWFKSRFVLPKLYICLTAKEISGDGINRSIFWDACAPLYTQQEKTFQMFLHSKSNQNRENIIRSFPEVYVDSLQSIRWCGNSK